MVFCTYCGQSFTRDEHLERHILTHTNVKPFKCFTCHMSFARRDLLQRHYTVHGKDQNNQEIAPAANGMIPKSAGRTPIACSNCAKTKTKCDKKFPCSRCAARNLRCTVRPTRRTAKNGSRSGIIPDAAGAVVFEPGQESEQASGPPKQPPLRPLGPATSAVQTSAQQLDEKSVPPTVDGPPSQYLERPTTGPRATVMGTPVTSPAHFVNSTPLSAYEEFSQMNAESSESDSSPRFMLDWSQVPLPMGFEGGVVQPQMLLTPDMGGFDPSGMTLTPAHGMPNMMPNFASGLSAPLITPPTEMPKLERGFSHVDLQNQYHPIPAHQRHNPSTRASTLQQGDIRGEMAAIVAARDAWTCFRCTPMIPSSACPKTARLNLERLEQTLKNHDGWSTWSPQSDQNDSTNGDHLTVMQLHESTRDKLLAITQTFLHKALEIHRDGAVSPDNRHDSLASGVSNFVLLPPIRVLEYFLRSYANCFERYYPLTSRGILDANELMHCFNDRAASLQVLMMIAQGAMNIPSVEARMLTGGLTEACRISLFDVIEKDINMAGDPIVLHSALIFAVQAAWSGDKWQMDIAMGQRGMYLAMLRHTGSLESSSNKSAHPSPHVPYINTDYLWNDWLRNESRSRLVYSWAMVDQELALFHDMAPLFAVTEFSAPMPDADRLWHAKNAAEWSSLFEQVHEFSNGYTSVGSGIRPLSLRALFRHLLDEDLLSMGIQLTPLHLRLLLHPLQSLVYQCKQLLSCFSDTPMERNSDSHSLTAFSTGNRLAEVQNLLKYWFGLAERYMDAHPSCTMMRTTLIVFHLISLNVVTDFAAIEELARQHNTTSNDSSTNPGGLFNQRSRPFHNRCVSDVEEAMYHCGQVLRAVRHMSQSVRPPWWAAAIYRVALTLWADATAPSNDNRRHPPPPEFMNVDVSRVMGSSSHSSSPPQQPSQQQQQQQFRHQRSRSHNPEQFGSAAAAGMAHGPCFAIDAVAANDPHLLLYLTKDEGVPCLSRRDGSLFGIEDPARILTHCVDLIDIGAATRFSDGIKAKLERLAQGG